MSGRSQPLTDIGQFYKQVDDFKEKLVIILKQFGKEQEIIDLNKYYDKLLALKKVNVRKPIELFYEYGVTQYAENILERDEVFFLGKVATIETDVVPVNNTQVESITQHDIFFISQIRQIWQDLQPQVKRNIWNYVQVICILSEKVVGGHTLADMREHLIKEGKIV